MKHFKIMSTATAVFSFLLVCVSCGEKDIFEPEPKPAFQGSSIFVANEDGASSRITVNMEKEWRVSVPKGSSWISVSPLGGGATEVTLTVTVEGNNPALTERVGYFDIRAGEDVTRYYVIQSPTEGISLRTDELYAGSSASVLSFTVDGNIGYTVTAKEDWMGAGDISYSDPVVLDDGVTESEYVSSSFSVNLQANDGDVRYGTLVIADESGAEYEVEVGQWGNVEPDFSRPFIRRSLAVRLTSTNCGYCPGMDEQLMEAVAAYPGHIVPVNMYGYMTGDDGLVYVDYDSYADVFGVTGYPTAVVNNCARMENTVLSQADAFEHLAGEAVEDIPSETCVAGVVMKEAETLNIDLSIASRETGNYGLGILILEDSIEYYQAGKGWQYIHNNVLLGICTPVFSGEEIALSAGTVESVSVSVPVPDWAVNPANIHVVVYMTRKGSYDGSVSGIIYDDYCGYVVDNVTDIPAGGFTVFDYEQ